MELTGSAAPVLAAATEVLRAPMPEILFRLSAALAPLAPHRAAAQLSAHCGHTPLKTCGEPGLTSRITDSELARLSGVVAAGQAWQGRARIAGEERAVLAVASGVTATPSVLVLVLAPAGPRAGADPEPLSGDALATVLALWDLVSSHTDRMAVEAVPGPTAQSRATAAERSRIIAELGDAHEAALTGLLGVLRSRSLDDAGARARATELAVTALLDQRAEAERDQALTREPAEAAFTTLAGSLAPMFRHGPVRLELSPPGENRDRPLPSPVVHAMRAAVRAVVLSVLEQDPLRRVQVGWQVTGGELRGTVRDDGPGELSKCSLAVHRVDERLGAVGGDVVIDAVPGWGTTVTATVPLGPPGAPAADPLSALGSRELEVLGHLAQGRRNRAIAAQLHISESTVKFHVTNILTKLEVGSRGEAAARFRAVAA
ncbi:helix-turn-helix transcriptional regulator [Streptomyces sp. NBC_00388]|uniref:helix-turn-helix transcriptional regulator n=1 Tax=Streptomyces sp. NBC_00388 TaxID=2975735 RepID=UPI002E1F6F4A